MKPAAESAASAAHYTFSGVPDSAQGLALAKALQGELGLPAPSSIIHVALSDRAARSLAEALPFFAPHAEILYLPAWDCLPYDRASPLASIVAERIKTLNALSANLNGKNRIILTTVNAVLQKLPPREAMASAVFVLEAGKAINRDKLIHYLGANGYIRVGKAMEAGEFALRGSIIDLIIPGDIEGIRVDLFGDEIESIRQFDPLTQLSAGKLERVSLQPMSEILLSEESIERFRSNYRELFGAVSKEDPLYEAVSDGRRYPGMEHWLPLFYERLENLFDYVPNALITFEARSEDSIAERQETIRDYYETRKSTERTSAQTGAPYHPVPPEQFYLTESGLDVVLARETAAFFTPFESTDSKRKTIPLGFRAGVNFAALRKDPAINPFDQLQEFIGGARSQGRATILATLTTGSRERLATLLSNHGLHCVKIENYAEKKKLSGKTLGLAVLPLEHGFEAKDTAIVSEHDLLGERIIRSKPKKRKADAFLNEAASFLEGELVVHKEHGIGRFDGLVTLTIGGAQHDCLRLLYAGDDKLFLPVENIDLLSRFGSDEEEAKLDKLGSASWQARKARMKERIKIAAEHLITIAAERQLREAPALIRHDKAYDAFVARFPYMETEDQERSIEEVREDLSSGHPMDRLICGDVGFGKTEVALRAAFIATHAEGFTPSPFQGEGRGEGSNSKLSQEAYPHPKPGAPNPLAERERGQARTQVAVVAPTTLLARQHYKNFKERFEGFGITVRQLSRMVTAKDQKLTKEGLKDGSVDIVVGTHALLSKTIEFKNLGLVIVDEEQHFGVGQKERLKELKSGVHVLTLSATPIPRTLQMALTGVRNLSLITTPPVDRLAIRSFVMPFDPVVIREAILREKNRGGRTFLVTARIKDIADLSVKIRELVPEINIAVAHGQMPANDLDTIMNEFYDGKYDLLISTAIIESGLDIPTANTMIIHRADRFGLAQLYQMRGRVGRGKTRAYAYFLLPNGKVLSSTATKRLEVMQTLDSLGAGFTLASHDMDIRGFGNLVGEEQSGHVREVGIELYQQMLMDAVENLRRKKAADLKLEQSEEVAEEWSPQINLGMSVLIPEDYISDLQLRMGLYRRAAYLREESEIDALSAELVDRFGPYPEEVEHLLEVVKLKQLCRAASVERVDMGPKGTVIGFRSSALTSPEALLTFIARHPTTLKLRPDEKLVVAQEGKEMPKRMQEIKKLLQDIAGHLQS